MFKISYGYLVREKILFFRYLYTLDKNCVSTKSDQTFEMIMTDLDPEKMKIFYQEYTNSAAEATKVYILFKIKFQIRIFYLHPLLESRY
jgi:hypothetical protein